MHAHTQITKHIHVGATEGGAADSVTELGSCTHTLHCTHNYTQITKHIRVRATEGGAADGVTELGSFTPAFLWLLRDFYFDMHEEGRQVNAHGFVFD